MNKETKDINKNAQKDQKVTARKTASFANEVNTEDVNYSYYSRVLNQPFDSLIELRAAEAEYYDKLKAKEDKAAQKKADAQLVEEAFKALNTTRRVYKETLLKLTEAYSVDLKKLKETFEADKKEIQDILAQAEETYSKALKAFTDKYPEGYHLTLKDGDFETTISRSNNTVDKSYTIFDIFSSMFGL
jgi:uncharacterized protein YdiU (UPF0061 family)